MAQSCNKQPDKLTKIAASLFLMFGVTAHSQNAIDTQACFDFSEYRHIVTTEPHPPDGTLRKENINDDEVREVQDAALGVFPDAIVSIAGVTDGCDCEDGSKCTAQIWLALNRRNRTRSLVLSKIDGHWKIGAVQSWWIEYNAHQASFKESAFDRRLSRLSNGSRKMDACED